MKSAFFLAAAVLAAGSLLADGVPQARAEESGVFALTARSRVPAGAGGTGYQEQTKALSWKAYETAVIVCDMWDAHWCRSASRRTAELAPRADAFVSEARKRGALIIHAPSGCMAAYETHPGRKLAQSAPAAPNLPQDIGRWCYRIPAEERGVYPVDQSDGGCDCNPTCPTYYPWKRQIETIKVADQDAVSDSGAEIWNLMEARGIKNVLILGVHTNMCVLGRPFGLRNMARFGKNVALVRDLTDTMYNPRAWPYVDHFRGTDLVVEHVEKFVCPTITSDQLLGGKPYRFLEDRRR